jgi:hypothetical protein
VPILHAGWYRGQWFLWIGSVRPNDPTSSLPPSELRTALASLLPSVSEFDPPRALDLAYPNPDGSESWQSTTVYGVALRAALLRELVALERQPTEPMSNLVVADEVECLSRAYRLAHELVRDGQYIPGVVYHLGYFRPIWKPWWTPRESAYLAALGNALPEVSRALGGPETPAAQPLLEQWISDLVDGLVRQASQPLDPGLPGPYGTWLRGLTSHDHSSLEPRTFAELLSRSLAKWEEDSRRRLRLPYRLCLRVEEHRDAPQQAWFVRLLAEPKDFGGAPLDAEDSLLTDEEWSDLLLWASPYCEPLSHAIANASLEGFLLDTPGLLSFIDNDAPGLMRAGATILMPGWWRTRKRRLNLTARITASSPVARAIRIGDVNHVDWSLALGDDRIDFDELRALAASHERLVQFRGQWVELSDDVARWAHRLQSLPSEVDSGTAIRWGIEGQISGNPGADEEALPAQVQTEGWMAEVIRRLIHHESIESVDPSPAFVGTLRPYQQRGLAWLDFLHRFGLGACLADDMGLGKTIQALALIDRDYQNGQRRPVLLVCPTSVVANWQREAERFTPKLPLHVHQGPDRLRGDDLETRAAKTGLFVTSYPLLRTDADTLLNVDWYGVVLDEAQNIKNASTRQSQIACRLTSQYRLALTGTPLENRLEELWALMRFLNPGLLGSQETFRRRYSGLSSPEVSEQDLSPLQRHIEPFLLRRLKTDPSIIDDLPDKIEIKEFCHLTREQAALYQAVLDSMSRDIASLDGMNRRGLILATLTRLKQILNHPAHYLGDHSSLTGRSGKLTRLDELVEEILGENHRALIFTQFAEMGALLESYLFQRWGERPLFLHGGVKPKDRETMVHRFQDDEHGPRLFLLSLRAGGTGLNLTQASHVIHYDRWWNPAVENQATDRAFRIGQHQNVTVHKFVSVGTVEERIDHMIEQKTLLAERIVGSGESWITELSTDDLHRLLALETPGEDENE